MAIDDGTSNKGQSTPPSQEEERGSKLRTSNQAFRIKLYDQIANELYNCRTWWKLWLFIVILKIIIVHLLKPFSYCYAFWCFLISFLFWNFYLYFTIVDLSVIYSVAQYLENKKNVKIGFMHYQKCLMNSYYKFRRNQST